MGYRAIAAVFDVVVVGLIWYTFIHFWGHYNEAENMYEVTGLPAVVLVSTTIAYWVVMEWILGATFGKLICDLRVVSLSGAKCSFAQSLKRNIFRPVDFSPCYFVGFVAAKLSHLQQRLGDQWAKTIVVKKDRKPLPEAAPQPPPFS